MASDWDHAQDGFSQSLGQIKFLLDHLSTLKVDVRQNDKAVRSGQLTQ